MIFALSILQDYIEASLLKQNHYCSGKNDGEIIHNSVFH